MKPKFRSEELEPFAIMLIGRMFARVKWEQEHGDAWGVESECAAMWWVVQALEKLAVATGGDRGAIHFSLATSNTLRQCADWIEHITGQRPEEG